MVETTTGRGSPLADGVEMFRRRRDAFRVQSARQNEASGSLAGCTSNAGGVVLKKIRSLDAPGTAVLPNLPAAAAIISVRRGAPVKLPGLEVRAGAAAQLRGSKGARGLVKWRSCDSGVEMAHAESLPPSPLVPGPAAGGWGGGGGGSSVSDETEAETDAVFLRTEAPRGGERRRLTRGVAVDERRAAAAASCEVGGARRDRPDGLRGRSLSDGTEDGSCSPSPSDAALQWGACKGGASSHDDLDSVESWEEYINNHTQLNQMRSEGEMAPGSGLCHLDQLCRLMEKMGRLKEANRRLQEQKQQLRAELQTRRQQEWKAWDV